jgi:hypothetical protein
MTDKLKEYLAEHDNEYIFKNPNILSDVIVHFQDLMEYAFHVEGIEENMQPKMILGEENVDNESEKTRTYEQPVLSITLSKRMSCGTNDKSLTGLFHNNLIAGVPKFIHKVKKIEDEEIEFEQGVFFTDNELCLTLKTKTVKEQIVLINLIERALNIYSATIRPDFVVVCGIKEIKTESKKDSINFETAKIYFQLRLKEIVNIDRLFLLRGFKIFTGQDKEIEVSNGKLDKEGNWQDNVVAEFEQFNKIK